MMMDDDVLLVLLVVPSSSSSTKNNNKEEGSLFFQYRIKKKEAKNISLYVSSITTINKNYVGEHQYDYHHNNYIEQ